MPTNKVVNPVVEKMAKQEYEYQRKIEDDQHAWVDKSLWKSTPWERLSDLGKKPWRQQAVRGLAIVQSRTYGATDDAGGEIVACEEDLADALYLALRAKEKEEADAKEENGEETD